MKIQITSRLPTYFGKTSRGHVHKQISDTQVDEKTAKFA